MNPRPRGRLFQDSRFEVAELRGRSLERLVGLASRNESDDRPEVMLLKPVRGHWQRFFLDAGIGFWEEWSEIDAFADCSDLRGVDYGARLRLIGDRIRRVRCFRDAPHQAAAIALKLDSGVLVLRSVDPALRPGRPSRVLAGDAARARGLLIG